MLLRNRQHWPAMYKRVQSDGRFWISCRNTGNARPYSPFRMDEIAKSIGSSSTRYSPLGHSALRRYSGHLISGPISSVQQTPMEIGVSPYNTDICCTRKTFQNVLLAVTCVTRTSDKHSAKPVLGRPLNSSA